LQLEIIMDDQDFTQEGCAVGRLWVLDACASKLREKMIEIALSTKKAAALFSAAAFFNLLASIT
jgi:hypothetical protein